jgi:hypothetical protein
VIGHLRDTVLAIAGTLVWWLRSPAWWVWLAMTLLVAVVLMLARHLSG